MEVTELRIGNLIDDGLGNIGQVNLVILQILEEKPYHTYKPIQLTEEWLIKFGFKGDNNQDKYFDVNSACYLHMSNGKNIVYLYDEDNDNELADCKYVHQLQNLYFVLTGKELTIKVEA